MRNKIFPHLIDTLILLTMKVSSEGEFLNVDLEIESVSKLDQVVEDLGDSVFVLYLGSGPRGRQLLCLEGSSQPKTPDMGIHRFCTALERLSTRGWRLWERARYKNFDIGYELHTGTSPVHIALKPESLKSVVGIGATISFTCYRNGRGTVTKTFVK